MDPKALAHLKPDERAILNWHMKRRKAQTCPTVTRGASKVPYIWMLRGGRGSGKTLTAANHLFEYARFLALTLPQSLENDIIRIALVGQNFSDVRGTMCEGQSGLLSVIPKELVKKWNRTYVELTVEIPSALGTDGNPRIIKFTGYTSMAPDKLRGPQFHAAWIDEIAKLEDSNEEPMGNNTTWSNLFMCTRLGKEVNAPHIVVTGTPTPCKLVRYLEEHPDSVITFMTTLENLENLPEAYGRELHRMNKNSRTYRQEVLAEILDDNPDAVFNEESIDLNRYEDLPDQELNLVLGWDPSVGTSEEGDEAGIILTGYTPEIKQKAKGAGGRGRPTILEPAHAYLLEDLSGHISPYDQVALVIDTVLKRRVGDLVFETNQGSDILITMLEQVLKERAAGNYTIRKEKKRRREDHGSVQRYNIQVTWTPEDATEPCTHKFTASGVHVMKNKQTRAETASMKYDQGQVHHPDSNHLPTCENEMCRASLEYQMTNWNPNAKASHRRSSPDRLDALVYCLFLIFGPGGRKTGANSWLTAPTSTVSTNSYGTTGSQIQQDSDLRKKKRATSIYSKDLVSGREAPSSNRVNPEHYESIYSRPVYHDPLR